MYTSQMLVRCLSEEMLSLFKLAVILFREIVSSKAAFHLEYTASSCTCTQGK
jgi:hypothetical protein